ncbi:cytochrome P450, family 706, subfamily A, polypeptide 7 [Actinidia rufa]|uniref:Cytochrome P450, family 706, subfamily A, polypeptide 7 n=1 Tax=Actinidia rufa TaxID=165716 RepID=A0A7J0G834_9ERIC|nr:cytochrome P450, family 706, subfamily A, polypeptide 7 [Actinidia rufa]
MFQNLPIFSPHAWSRWFQTTTADGDDDLARVFFTSALVLLAIAWFLYIFFLRPKKVHPPLPPGPLGLPLVGNLPFLDPELHTYFSALAQTHGPILTLRLGNKLGVVITSPAAAREVLKDHDVIFANRDVTVAGREAAYGGSDIVWTPYGPEWRMLRKVCVREMLSNATLDSVYTFRRRELRRTINYIYSQVGSRVNVGEQMFLTVLNVITSMLWGGTVRGEDRGSLGAEFRQVVTEMTELLGKPNLSDFFPGLARFDLQGIREQMKGLAKRFDRIFDVMIDQRLRLDGQGGTRTESKDFLQVLLKLKDDGDAKTPLTMTHLKALLMDMVVGGTDTRPPTRWSLPRICAGTAMAERMFMYALASVVHSFDWKLPEGEKLDVSEKFGIVLKKKIPLVAIPMPRLSDPGLYESKLEDTLTGFRSKLKDTVGMMGKSSWHDESDGLCERDMLGATTVDAMYALRLHEIRGAVSHHRGRRLAPRLKLASRCVPGGAQRDNENAVGQDRDGEGEGDDRDGVPAGGGGRDGAAGETEFVRFLSRVGPDMVVGGTDMTSNTVKFAMAEMMYKREVMKKAKQEMDTVIGKDTIVEESHIPKRPYLHAVMKEVLRLHPALPLVVPHCPSESCVVGGYAIPKGAWVFVNMRAIQRDPSIWENPTEFDLERQYLPTPDGVHGLQQICLQDTMKHEL